MKIEKKSNKQELQKALKEAKCSMHHTIHTHLYTILYPFEKKIVVEQTNNIHNTLHEIILVFFLYFSSMFFLTLYMIWSHTFCRM